MRLCDIRDVSDIASSLEGYLNMDNPVLYARQTLHDKGSYVWFRDEEMFLLFQRIGPKKYTVHISGGRGSKSTKELKQMFKEASRLVMDQTQATAIISFCASSNRALALLLRSIGFERTGEVPMGSGEEHDVIFTYNKQEG